MEQNNSERSGGARLLILSLPVPNQVQSLLDRAAEGTHWTPHWIWFHGLQHRARAPSRTDLQRKLNGWSPYYHFSHLTLELEIPVQFVSLHTCHWGCIFPTAITEVTDCREGYTDPPWFVQSLQFAELSAGRRAGLSQITRCFSSVQAQAPDKFLASWQQQSSKWNSSRTTNVRGAFKCLSKTRVGHLPDALEVKEGFENGSL